MITMQQHLPAWLAERLADYQLIDYVAPAFEDSTHQLWHLKGKDADQTHYFLKVCSNTDSPFWSIMQSLFEFELKSEIANFSKLYAFLERHCRINIPKLIKCETTEQGAYIITSQAEGSTIDEKIHDQMVKQLANHIAELHSVSKNSWGVFSKPHMNTSAWSHRLADTLIKSSKKWGGVFLQSNYYLKQALADCAQIKSTSFVPMMTDLRWDQFLQYDNQISALVDLDAFVYAPRELDFVILEYLLSADQAELFKTVYVKQHDIPNLDGVRTAYRLLLFYMQILGEQDLDSWMNKEMLF